MADGQGTRWNNYLGVPKHLIDIDGEQLLYRTVRLLKKQGIEDIWITSHDERYDVPGATRYEPNNNEYEIDRFYSCREIWTDEVCFIYGDVYYTEEAINKITSDKSKTFRYFGRSKPSKTGKDHAELFAIKITKDYINKFEEACLKIRSYVEKGIHKRGLGWHTYLKMHNKEHHIDVELLRDYLKNNKLKNFTEINDETDDFDNPIDYDTFINKNKIVFYLSKIWMGGTFKSTLALIQRLHKYYDIEILYDKDSNKEFINKFLDYVPVKRITKTISCKTCVNVTLYMPNRYINANEYVQWFHSAVNELQVYMPIRLDTKSFITVSEEGKKQADQRYGIDSNIIYNEIDQDIKILAEQPIELEDADLKLVSVSRISEEKGFDNKLIIAQALKEKGINFKWYIVGEAKTHNYFTKIKEMFKDIPEVEFVGRKINPYPYMKWADYVVTPSRRETWNLVVQESLFLNTPVISTNFPAIYEQVKDGENGYIFKMDMSDFDVKKIMTIPKVKYELQEHYRKWFDILGEPKLKDQKIEGKMEIKAILGFKDLEYDIKRIPGETWLVSIERGKELFMTNAPIEILKVHPYRK